MEQLNWNEIITTADSILFFCFVIFVGYLFVFAIASLKTERSKYPQTLKQYRYAVLFAVQHSDSIILDSVKSFMEQNYKGNFNIIVVYHNMEASIVQELKELPVILLETPNDDFSRSQMLDMPLNNSMHLYMMFR